MSRNDQIGTAQIGISTALRDLRTKGVNDEARYEALLAELTHLRARIPAVKAAQIDRHYAIVHH